MLIRRLAAAALACLLWTGAQGQGIVAPAAPRPGGDTVVAGSKAGIDAARAELEGVEAALRRPTLSADELQGLRDRIEPVANRLRDALAAVAPELEAARARLDGLGPKPKDGAGAEGAEVARDRADRETTVAGFDEAHRLARAALLQAEQLIAHVNDRRRSAFATALFQHGHSIASPGLWAAVAEAAPGDLRAAEIVAADALSRIRDRASPIVLTLLALAIGVGTALHIGRGHIAPHLALRAAAATAVSPYRRLVAALATFAVETLPALAGSFVIYGALTLLDVLPPPLVPVAGAILGGLAFIAFASGLAKAIFAPERAAWRLMDVSDATAGRALTFTVGFAAVVVAGKVLAAANGAIAAGLPLAIAARGLVALAAAATLAEWLRRSTLPDIAPDEACLGPYIPTDATSGGPLRVAGWALVATIAGAALAGYVAFASFLVDQVAWIASLGGLLYLGLEACDRFIGGTLKEESRVSTTLQTNLGLRRRSLIQLGVLLGGLGRVVLVIVAALLALAPWGIESGDIASNVRAAYFGFKVGDVTVSLATVVGAVGSFALAIAATRIVQRWLERSFLPTTELDAGLRNSIGTAAGYVGYFAAAAVALGYLGLSLDKIAIVAGALSVGIGFGLQSIVNNFVSGLILLWERPIRVGDLVVVGDGEGYVRRISVRATEIETLERSTIIVPNSNLISGVVKNRVRGDRTGRITLPVNVLRNQDPVRAAAILIECAASHPAVTDEPPPRVLFKKIGDTWLEFELVCVVDDVTAQPRVQSELNFSVFQALVDEKIMPPLGPGAMNVGGLEPVQAALDGIADAISRAGPDRLAPASALAGPEPSR